MAVTEKQRHDLFTMLEEALGPEHATTMMELLPPVGWADVATKHDLDALRVATKQDIDGLRVATKQDIDGVRREMATKADLADLRSEIRRDIVTWLLTGMGIQTAVVGLLVGFSR